ncbi:MAG TPA: Flp family type IVb pilin [Bryobacteraceae bacterium]|nr:Flp family type IVb pilin [Bryobacteraceae bacterium]
MQLLLRFLRDEQGQDLIEYALLVGFITLASAGILLDAQPTISGMWGTANNTLSNAATSAS